MDGQGRLRHRSTYQLRSNDYESSRNGGVYVVPLQARGFTWLPLERNLAGRVQPLGRLDASGSSLREDGCRASCVEWSGNVRVAGPTER